jgi:hypothetical protein
LVSSFAAKNNLNPALDSYIGDLNVRHVFTVTNNVLNTDLILIKYPRDPYIPSLESECRDSTVHSLCIVFPKLNWALMKLETNQSATNDFLLKKCK